MLRYHVYKNFSSLCMNVHLPCILCVEPTECEEVLASYHIRTYSLPTFNVGSPGLYHIYIFHQNNIYFKYFRFHHTAIHTQYVNTA